MICVPFSTIQPLPVPSFGSFASVMAMLQDQLERMERSNAINRQHIEILEGT